MIALWLLSAHMAGDYIFQSAHMAAHKLTDRGVRFWHVAVYCCCFAPVALVYADDKPWWHYTGFMACLFVAHFLTDSKRWRTSNPWPAMPILQDQSLHVVQIAVFAGIFLS